MLFSECHSDEYRYTVCHFAECHSAECGGTHFMTHFQFEPLQLQLETFLLIQFVLPETKHLCIPISISVLVKMTHLETGINKNY
jgi:hypothetical protein